MFLLAVLISPLLLPAHDGRGQNTGTFRVLQASGPVAYRSSAKAPWKEIGAANPNPTLSAMDEVKLTNQSILILEPTVRIPIVIQNRPGVARVSDLLSASATGGTNELASVMGDYFKNLWHNLTHKHETVDSYARGFMKTKGVVSRGCAIPLMLTPDYGASLVSDTSLTFTWQRDPSVQRYTMAIYDGKDPKAKTLYTTDTADTTLVFTLDKPFIEKDVTYYWSVFPAGDPNCARYTFTLVKSDALRELEAKMADIDAQLRGSVALTAFVKAALYEGNHFYSEAYRAYFQAHRLSPTNPLFRDGFALFLARRGMTEQAKALLAVR